MQWENNRGGLSIDIQGYLYEPQYSQEELRRMEEEEEEEAAAEQASPVAEDEEPICLLTHVL